MNEDVPGQMLRKITLPKAKHHELLFKLHQHWISRAHLMPTLDNVTGTILKMSKYRGSMPHSPAGEVLVKDGAISIRCCR